MATIHEVARRAGVSSATVSRYLAGQSVRAAEDVRAAIADLAYSPSLVARGLRSGRHHTIGVVVPDLTNPFFAAVVKGIESVTRDHGYQVLLANSDESTEREVALLEGLLPRVDGLVLAPATEQDPSPARFAGGDVPLVLVDRDTTGDPLVDTVLVDNDRGARLAARHLLDLGHTRIGVVSGSLTSTPGRARHEAFLAELASAGHPARLEYVVEADFRISGGHAAALRLLDLAQPPTAVFSANNLMTVGVLSAIRERGVRVPDEISVVGFDDLDVGHLLDPPLTVVDRPTTEQGARAAGLLLERLAPGSAAPPRRLVLDVALTVRGSTAPPPAGRGGGRRPSPRTTPTATSPSTPGGTS